MSGSAPHIIILSGPNGAGKSTAAPRLLKGALRVDEFVNADTIARGLSAFAPERVAFQAGRVMLARLRDLAQQRASFAFETTLASRSFAPWVTELIAQGYRVSLIYLVLPTADAAIQRVQERVRRGGHDVPEDTIQRRFHRGLDNFFQLYQPLVTSWRVYDNATGESPKLVAFGKCTRVTRVLDAIQWTKLQELADNPERR